MLKFFILGRNPELSRAEVYSYLEARDINFKEIMYKENALMLEFLDEQKLLDLSVQDFGGVLNIGTITFKGNVADLKKYIEKEDLIPSDKFTYSLFGNFEQSEDWLIDKFKTEKRKAIIRRVGRNIENQDGRIIEMPKSDFQLFCFLHNEIFFGLVEQSYNYKDVMQRDMRKPVRREELAISPRLAKILINLSQARENQVLLDPFCGIGVILQEALLKRINVIGVDIDKEAIEGAKKNLLWLQSTYATRNNYELINKNSALIDMRFDAIASESSLGELLKHKPSRDEAQDIIDEFEIKVIPVLRSLKRLKTKEGKIAITFPYVRESGVDIERICEETGLSIYNLRGIKFPIREYREDQRVSREIVVFV